MTAVQEVGVSRWEAESADESSSLPVGGSTGTFSGSSLVSAAAVNKLMWSHRNVGGWIGDMQKVSAG